MNPTETTEMQGLIAELKSEGLTILLIEQKPDMVMRLSDRVIVMDEGKKIAEGAGEDVGNDARVIEAYLGRQARSMRRSRSWRRQRRAGNRSRSACFAVDIFAELVRRGVRSDIVTDQTSAHDLINGYLPKGWTLAEWESRRNGDPKAVEAYRAGALERSSDGGHASFEYSVRVSR